MTAPICANPVCSDPIDLHKPLVPSTHPRRYCSKRCARDVRDGVRWAERRATHPPCLHCGNAFEPTRIDRQFCNAKCSGAFNRARTRGGPTKRPWIDWSSVEGILKETVSIQFDDVAPELGPCRIWQRARGRKGYAEGWDTTLKQSCATHIVLARLIYGNTRNQEVGHRCGKGRAACVNPNHLELVSQTENRMEKSQRNWLERCIVDRDAENAALRAMLMQLAHHIGHLRATA